MSTALLALLATAQAHELVAVLALSRDLADGLDDVESAAFGVGPYLGLAAGFGLADARARLSLGLELQGGAGWDRIEWVDDGTRYYDVDHLAVVWSARVLVGPTLEIPVPDGVPIRPTVTVGVGGGRVWTHHDFDGPTGPLMDPQVNDLASSTNLDPYTAQWVAAVGGSLGARVRLPVLDMDLVLEAGYTVSYVPTAKTRRTLAEFDVVRADYGLNVARVGVGFALPL